MLRYFRDPRDARAKIAYCIATATTRVHIQSNVVIPPSIMLTPLETLGELLEGARSRGVDVTLVHRPEQHDVVTADDVTFIGTALMTCDMMYCPDIGMLPACVTFTVCFLAEPSGGMTGVAGERIERHDPLLSTSFALIETDHPAQALDSIVHEPGASVFVITHADTTDLQKTFRSVVFYVPGCINASTRQWRATPVIGTTLLTENGLYIENFCFRGQEWLSYVRHMTALYYIDTIESEKRVPCLALLCAQLSLSPRLKMVGERVHLP